jgi:hypothetical protein
MLRYAHLTSRMEASRREKLSDILLDLILESGNADKLTAGLGRSLMDAARGDELANENGLEKLLEASALLEPEKAAATLEAQGFPELANELKKAAGK